MGRGAPLFRGDGGGNGVKREPHIVAGEILIPIYVYAPFGMKRERSSATRILAIYETGTGNLKSNFSSKQICFYNFKNILFYKVY